MLLGGAWCRLLGISLLADEISSAVLTIDTPGENSLSGSHPAWWKPNCIVSNFQCKDHEVDVIDVALNHAIPWIEQHYSCPPTFSFSLFFSSLPRSIQCATPTLRLSCHAFWPAPCPQKKWFDMVCHCMNAWFKFMRTCQDFLDGDPRLWWHRKIRRFRFRGNLFRPYRFSWHHTVQAQIPVILTLIPNAASERSRNARCWS